jgi:hypothetical protein
MYEPDKYTHIVDYGNRYYYGDPQGVQCMKCGNFNDSFHCAYCETPKNIDVFTDLSKIFNDRQDDLIYELIDTVEILEEALKQSESELMHYEQRCKEY